MKLVVPSSGSMIQRYSASAGAARAALFAEKGVVGIGFFEVVNNFLFRCAIDFGDEIVGGFFVDPHVVELFDDAGDDLAGFAGGFEGDGQHRLHG